jgi:hypothetical protein
MCMIWRTNFEPLAKEHMNVMLLLKLIVSFTWNQPVSCMHCLISCISACSSTTILHPQLSKSATSYLNHDKWSPNWILQWVKVRNLMSGFSYGWKIFQESWWVYYETLYSTSFPPYVFWYFLVGIFFLFLNLC